MRALDGLRVADFTSNIAGPYATMLMGDAGAEVIKVESPSGDAARNWGSWHDEGRSFMFMAVNRNKRSVVLDLKTKEGREQARELMSSCDVVAQSFAPGVADRLGIGFDVAREVNSSIVYLSISGYGLSGPSAHKLGFDSILQAETGIMEMNGHPDSPTARVPISALDYATGALGYAAVMTELVGQSRRSGGEPSHIDMSLFDAAVSVLGAAIPEASVTGSGPVRTGGAFAYQCPYGVYQASDGEIFLAVGSTGAWTRFCEAFGLVHLLGDDRLRSNPGRLEHRDLVEHQVSLRLGTLTVAECIDRAEAASVPASPINRVVDLICSPHAQARESFLTVSTASGTAVKVPGPSWHVAASGAEPSVRHTAPEPLGASTEQVLNALGDSRRSQDTDAIL